jgi:hypothetical protein
MTRNISNRKRGSMIMEVILALAIFSIICLPILTFIFSSEEFQRVKNRSEAESYIAMITSNFQWMKPSNINEYSNRHACDSALASYVAALTPSTPVISYPDFFHHDRNIISSIRSISHKGNTYLILGTNSASTTDTDMYVFTEIGRTVVREIETGPGVVDFDIANGYLYAIERSVVQPLWRISLDALVDSAAESPVENIPMLLSSVLPLRILATPDWLFLGLDKNLGKEALIIERISSGSSDAFVLTGGNEIDAGVNDMTTTPHELLVASPNNIEVFGFGISGLVDGTGIGIDGLPITRSIDLSGSAGNGKSLSAYKQDLYLGRTVGNIEFHKRRGSSTAATIDVNKTILQVEEIFGGSYVAILAKTPNPSLLLYIKNAAGGYALRESIPLPAIPTGMTCTPTEFLIGMDSTSIPLVSIRF